MKNKNTTNTPIENGTLCKHYQRDSRGVSTHADRTLFKVLFQVHPHLKGTPAYSMLEVVTEERDRPAMNFITSHDQLEPIAA